MRTPDDDDWELSPETAHPDAARLLQEPFYWDPADEHSPFGSDAAADALSFYRAALEDDPDLDSGEFLEQLFDEWDLDRDFAVGVPDEELAHRLEREHFHILTYDDVIIAVAFAELMLRGTVSPDMVEAAVRSLERQALPELLEFRGWSDPTERRERCEEMIGALRAA